MTGLEIMCEIERKLDAFARSLYMNKIVLDVERKSDERLTPEDKTVTLFMNIDGHNEPIEVTITEHGTHGWVEAWVFGRRLTSHGAKVSALEALAREGV